MIYADIKALVDAAQETTELSTIVDNVNEWLEQFKCSQCGSFDVEDTQMSQGTFRDCNECHHKEVI